MMTSKNRGLGAPGHSLQLCEMQMFAGEGGTELYFMATSGMKNPE